MIGIPCWKGEIPQAWAGKLIVNQQFVDKYEKTKSGDILRGESNSGEEQIWEIRRDNQGNWSWTESPYYFCRLGVAKFWFKGLYNQININLVNPVLSSDITFREQL